MLRYMLLAITLSSLAVSSGANNLRPPTKPLIHPVQKTNFQLVGSAKFSVLFWDIYHSRLYTETGQYSEQHRQRPLLFEISYLRDITKQDLIKRTIEQWQHIGLPEHEYQAYLPLITKIWPNISAGDTLTLLINTSESTFYYNQTAIGTIPLPNFGQQFIDIWLSPRTSQPKLRTQLIGASQS